MFFLLFNYLLIFMFILNSILVRGLFLMKFHFGLIFLLKCCPIQNNIRQYLNHLFFPIFDEMKENNSPFFRIKIIASLLSAISCVVTFFCILYNILEVFASVCKVFLIYQKTNQKEFAEAVNLTKTNRLSQCF